MSFWDCFWLLSLQPFTDVQQNGEEQLERKAILPHNRSYDRSYNKAAAPPRVSGVGRAGLLKAAGSSLPAARPLKLGSGPAAPESGAELDLALKAPGGGQGARRRGGLGRPPAAALAACRRFTES